jgi:hypothetical protein
VDEAAVLVSLDCAGDVERLLVGGQAVIMLTGALSLP